MKRGHFQAVLAFGLISLLAVITVNWADKGIVDSNDKFFSLNSPQETLKLSHPAIYDYHCHKDVLNEAESNSIPSYYMTDSGQDLHHTGYCHSHNNLGPHQHHKK